MIKDENLKSLKANYNRAFKYHQFSVEKIF